MKKKCTNSNCRKVFTITVDNNVVCPFCGKKYPRIGLLNSKWEAKNEKRIIEK